MLTLVSRNAQAVETALSQRRASVIDGEWHGGDTRCDTVVQFQFQNSVGDWCPRFERRTSSLLGQSLGLFASTSFKAGELVTVFCGRRQKPNTTPFCIESIYYQAKLRCGRQLIVVDAAGCGELVAWSALHQ